MDKKKITIVAVCIAVAVAIFAGVWFMNRSNNKSDSENLDNSSAMVEESVPTDEETIDEENVEETETSSDVEINEDSSKEKSSDNQASEQNNNDVSEETSKYDAGEESSKETTVKPSNSSANSKPTVKPSNSSSKPSSSSSKPSSSSSKPSSSSSKPSSSSSKPSSSSSKPSSSSSKPSSSSSKPSSSSSKPSSSSSKPSSSSSKPSSSSSQIKVNMKDVNSVISKINNLDSSVRLSSDTSISQIEREVEQAQQSYNRLNSEEKKLVSNYSKLTSTKSKLSQVKQQLDTVNTAISNIPQPITKGNFTKAEPAVIRAENAYSSLSADHKNGITPSKVSLIQQSRQSVETVRVEIDIDNGKMIVSRIASIDRTFALSSKESLNEIQRNLDSIDSDYSRLGSNGKRAVTNYGELQAAKSEFTNVREELYRVYRAIELIPSIHDGMTIDELNAAEVLVDEAQRLYDLVSPHQKRGVTPTELSIITFGKENIIRIRNEKLSGVQG